MCLVVFDRAVFQGEKSKIAAETDVLAWMEFGPALANDDVARDRGLTAKQFHAQPLRLAVAAVHCSALTFLVRHGSVLFKR